MRNFIYMLFLLTLISCAEMQISFDNELEMVYVESGEFRLGSPDKERGRKYDETLNDISIKHNFYMSRFEIRQQLFNKIMGYNPSYYKDPNKPVESIDWYDAIEFCNKLSLYNGLDEVYKIDKNNNDPNNYLDVDRKKWTVKINSNANGYRLPTEAQWEFAAKGGNKSHKYKYPGSNNISKVSVYGSDIGTSVVGSKSANELGLYDMSGNVSEWCYNWYSKYLEDDIKGKRKTLRGGSWFHSENMCRSSKRFYRRPDYGDIAVGVRVIRYDYLNRG